MDATVLEKQLEELQMVRCSLLPGEIMTFIDDLGFWDNFLEIHSTSGIIPDQLPIATSQAHFQIKVEAATHVWFEILFPYQYLGDLESCCPNISVKGQYLGRIEQERWQKIIEEKVGEIAGTEYVLSSFIC